MVVDVEGGFVGGFGDEEAAGRRGGGGIGDAFFAIFVVDFEVGDTRPIDGDGALGVIRFFAILLMLGSSAEIGLNGGTMSVGLSQKRRN